MPLEADQRVDRARLKRRLALWRIVAVAALAAAGLLAASRGGPLIKTDHIARLTVSGIILDDPARSEALAAAAKDDTVRALVVRIDSPGGTVVGGESLYHGLRAVGAKKPVAVVIGEMGTSAGYLAALGGDRIFAREGSITGSIGVILQATDVTGLLQKLGITTEALKSGPLKAVPSPLEPLSDEGRAATMAVIRDVYEMFVNLVAERRPLSREETLRLADGRVFTGRQGAGNGLIDEIGGESEAIDWLGRVRGIDPELPVRDITPDEGAAVWRELVRMLGGKALFSERLTLDGLVSLWHPDLG